MGLNGTLYPFTASSRERSSLLILIVILILIPCRPRPSMVTH